MLILSADKSYFSNEVLMYSSVFKKDVASVFFKIPANDEYSLRMFCVFFKYKRMKYICNNQLFS